jgi:hypothetical protein
MQRWRAADHGQQPCELRVLELHGPVLLLVFLLLILVVLLVLELLVLELGDPAAGRDRPCDLSL